MKHYYDCRKKYIKWPKGLRYGGRQRKRFLKSFDSKIGNGMPKLYAQKTLESSEGKDCEALEGNM